MAQQRRDSLFDRWIDPATGMLRLSGAIDPVRGETVLNALDDLVDQLVAAAKNDPAGTGLGFEPLEGETITRQQYAAHALFLLAGGRQAAAGRASVTLLLEAQTAASGFHDHTVAETSRGTAVPPSMVARLCCGAVFQAVSVDPLTGELRVGRKHRLATQAQRAVLAALYGSCMVDDCDVSFDDCEIHHVIEDWIKHRKRLAEQRRREKAEAKASRTSTPSKTGLGNTAHELLIDDDQQVIDLTDPRPGSRAGPATTGLVAGVPGASSERQPDNN